MGKIQAFAKKYTIIYCAIVEILILAVLTGIGMLLAMMVPESDYYVLMGAQEGIGAVIACGLIILSGQKKVLTRKGGGFGRGLLVGMYFLVISVYSIFIYLLAYEGERVMHPWYLIAAFFLCMFFVGVVEEFVFRGIIADLMLQKFGTSKSGIWKAVIVSGIFFGCAHLSNLFVSAPVGVLVQTIIASMMGMLLVAIYYRSGCIWVTVALHALIDIAAGITTGLYGNETMADSISAYSPIQLVSVIPYLIALLVLLRNKKLPEIEQNMKFMGNAD